MQNYASKGYLARNGVPIVRSSSIKVGQKTSAEEVDAILEDGVGVAFGNILYSIDIENPVPAEGFEVDWMVVCEAKGIHQLEFVLLKGEAEGGGVMKRLLLRGFFLDPDLTVSAGKAVAASVKFSGRTFSRAT